jgi:Tfp pilus assembly ATPase PilU
MKPMKLVEVRKHTGHHLTVEEAVQYVSQGQSETVTRNQVCALSLHSWSNSATDWLRLEACLVLLADKRRQK